MFDNAISCSTRISSLFDNAITVVLESAHSFFATLLAARQRASPQSRDTEYTIAPYFLMLPHLQRLLYRKAVINRQAVLIERLAVVVVIGQQSSSFNTKVLSRFFIQKKLMPFVISHMTQKFINSLTFANIVAVSLTTSPSPSNVYLTSSFTVTLCGCQH